MASITNPRNSPLDVCKIRKRGLISLTSFTFMLGRDPRTLWQKEDSRMLCSKPPGWQEVFSQLQRSGVPWQDREGTATQWRSLLGPGKRASSVAGFSSSRKGLDLQSCSVQTTSPVLGEVVGGRGRKQPRHQGGEQAGKSFLSRKPVYRR